MSRMTDAEFREYQARLRHITDAAQRRAGLIQDPAPQNRHALQPGQPFKDRNAVAEAMADPRYKADPAYRKEVASRMLGSGHLSGTFGERKR